MSIFELTITGKQLNGLTRELSNTMIDPDVENVFFSDNRTPEQSLCLAMLRQAFTDLKHEGVRRDAYQWLMSENKEVFSFEQCCEFLDLSHGSIRKQVHEYLPLFIKEEVEEKEKRELAKTRKGYMV